MDISLYSPLSPLFKVSITHLYYILTGLYLELLFTLKSNVLKPIASNILSISLFSKGNIGNRF